MLFGESDNLNIVAPPKLEQQDFPHITFWFRSNWPSKRGETDPKIFVETEDGEIVSRKRMDDMRKYARSLWDTFLGEGIAPQKWGEATTLIRQRYHRLMCKEFGELRFCDKDWKADHIATLHYPSWYKYWVTQGRDRKQKTRSRSVSRISVFHYHLNIPIL
jgi:hypothetical protein